MSRFCLQATCNFMMGSHLANSLRDLSISQCVPETGNMVPWIRRLYGACWLPVSTLIDSVSGMHWLVVCCLRMRPCFCEPLVCRPLATSFSSLAISLHNVSISQCVPETGNRVPWTWHLSGRSWLPVLRNHGHCPWDAQASSVLLADATLLS